MLLITSDRGLAGAYSSNVLKEGESLAELLRSEGKTVVPYITGRKGGSYYRFRRREIAREWGGLLRLAHVRGGPGDRRHPDPARS